MGQNTTRIYFNFFLFHKKLMLSRRTATQPWAKKKIWATVRALESGDLKLRLSAVFHPLSELHFGLKGFSDSRPVRDGTRRPYWSPISILSSSLFISGHLWHSTMAALVLQSTIVMWSKWLEQLKQTSILIVSKLTCCHFRRMSRIECHVFCT